MRPPSLQQKLTRHQTTLTQCSTHMMLVVSDTNGPDQIFNMLVMHSVYVSADLDM
jgi:hypothetical protein